MLGRNRLGSWGYGGRYTGLYRLQRQSDCWLGLRQPESREQTPAPIPTTTSARLSWLKCCVFTMRLMSPSQAWARRLASADSSEDSSNSSGDAWRLSFVSAVFIDNCNRRVLWNARPVLSVRRLGRLAIGNRNNTVAVTRTGSGVAGPANKKNSGP